MKIQSIVLFSLFLCLNVGCDIGGPIKEGTKDDTFIDKENHPFLYIDSKPKTKFKFINDISDIEDCPKRSGSNIPNKWIEIHQLKNEYYFHLSFGPGGLYKFIFCTDFFYEISSTGDDPGARPIIDFMRRSDQEFTYTVADRDPNIEAQRVINFYIIDEANQIAIVEDTGGFEKYCFMIAQQKTYDIPVLINFSEEMRILTPFEDFDHVNYEQILKEKGFR